MRLSPVILGSLLSREHIASRDVQPPATLVARVPVGTIIEHCTVPGVVALTFDDGPFYHTPHVLDLLDSYGAKGTFFINGENWSNNIADESTPWPETLRRMDASGHQIASHTFSHVDMTKASTETRYDQIFRLESTLARIIGKAPTYFRPPFASCEGQCLDDIGQMGLHIVHFDVDTKDYLHNTPSTNGESQSIFASALDKADGDDSFLVLTHDVQETTATTLLPFMLNMIREKGLRAVTVGECMGDPRANWYRGVA
ncbi:hypothetical protein QBC39DRAFT_71947 [Podospora conica]|nr:hypothetical protein QBC39DRAFT_71947 [Schizothecium conicum]